MTHEPKVSVVIITHNRAELLRQAMDSVLSQTFSDFELIVVDDCSQDHTTAVVTSIADPRIQYIRHDTNQGEGGARNTGIAHVRGQYVAFLDDDDQWIKNKLALQVARLDSAPETVGAVYTSVVQFNGETGEVISTRTAVHRGNILEKLIELGNFVPPSAVMIRQTCFNEVGWFDLQVPGRLDYDMWMRIAMHHEFEVLDAPLTRRRIHENQLSGNFFPMHIKGMTELMKKYDQYFGKRTKSNSRRYFLLGVWHCLTGNLQSGRRMYAKAIAFHPFNFKPYIAIGFTLFGYSGFRRLFNLVIG